MGYGLGSNYSCGREDLHPNGASEETQMGRLFHSCSFGMSIDALTRIANSPVVLIPLQACAIAQAVISIVHIDNGFGRHVQYLQPSQVVTIIRLGTATMLIDQVAAWLVRISVCLFILQFLPITEKFARWYVISIFQSLPLARNIQ